MKTALFLATVALAGVSLAVQPAFAQTSQPAQSPPTQVPPSQAAPSQAAGPFAIPMSRPTPPGPVEPLAAPKRFTAQRTIAVKGQKVAYTSIAGETYLYNRAGDPIGSLFSFTYPRDGPRDPRPPGMFVFNGGPGSSAKWLHTGWAGPHRVVPASEAFPACTRPSCRLANPSTRL